MPLHETLGIDIYSFRARVLPACLALSPYAVFVNSFAPHLVESELTKVGVISATLLVIGLILAPSVRDFGSKKEAELKKKWGGMPTTLLLEHPSDVFDEPTRKKYVSKLQQISNIREINGSITETETKSFDADAIISFLRESTRGPNFSIIHSENANYGMRRNLLGIKFYSLISSLIILLLHLTLDLKPIATHFSLEVFFTVIFSKIVPYSILVLVLCTWLFVVTEDWVRSAGNKYAKALIQAVDNPEVSKMVQPSWGKNDV